MIFQVRQCAWGATRKKKRQFELGFYTSQKRSFINLSSQISTEHKTLSSTQVSNSTVCLYSTYTQTSNNYTFHLEQVRIKGHILITVPGLIHFKFSYFICLSSISSWFFFFFFFNEAYTYYHTENGSLPYHFQPPSPSFAICIAYPSLTHCTVY